MNVQQNEAGSGDPIADSNPTQTLIGLEPRPSEALFTALSLDHIVDRQNQIKNTPKMQSRQPSPLSSPLRRHCLLIRSCGVN